MSKSQLAIRDFRALQNVNFIKLVDESTNQLNKNIFTLTESQARAILELRLHRLTSLERDDIQKDLEEFGRIVVFVFLAVSSCFLEILYDVLNIHILYYTMY